MRGRTWWIAGGGCAALLVVLLAFVLLGGGDEEGERTQLDIDAGIVLTPGRSNSYPHDVAIYDGGRIAVPVEAFDGRRWGAKLIRIGADDTEEETVDLPLDRPTAIGGASAGSLLVLGPRGGELALARVRPDGALDPRFRDGGVGSVTRGVPAAFASQPGGGQVAVALSRAGTEVLRVSPDGSAALPVTIEVPGTRRSESAIFALGIDGERNLVAAGEVLVGGGASARPFVARFDGAAVASVAVARESTPSTRWNSLAIHADGAATVGGTTRVDGYAAIATARFEPEASDGKVAATPFGRQDVFTAALLPAPDGGVFAATTANDRAHLVHLRKDGSHDTNFRPPSVPGRAVSAALQDDGSVIVVTSVWVRSRQGVGLRRLPGLGRVTRG